MVLTYYSINTCRLHGVSPDLFIQQTGEYSLCISFFDYAYVDYDVDYLLSGIYNLSNLLDLFIQQTDYLLSGYGP